MEARYLSIVIAARNDNYGGDFNKRLQATINHYCHYFECYRLPSEIVLVEYNPIKENPGLQECIQFPLNRKYVSIRIISVPDEVHQQYLASSIRQPLPFFEFPAKNIGIRRARGEFILSTNADILPGKEILKFIAERKLKSNYFYRADRADFLKNDSESSNPETAENSFEKTAFRIFTKGRPHLFGPGFIPFNLKISLIRCYNYFQNVWNLLKDRKGLQGNFKLSYHPADNPDFIYHTNCSGDFMLMHRDSWMALSGYPEETKVSTHTDALFTVMAGVSGLKEKVFNAPVFHQEHERRYNYTDIENDTFFKAVFAEFQQKARVMLQNRKVSVENTEHWGAGDIELAENII